WRTRSRRDAEEAVQEVFGKLARSPQPAAAARDPRAYLRTMAHRAAIDALRKRRGPAREPSVDLMAPVADPARASDAERASRLVAALPDAQREVVYLKHFAGETFEA